jgi:biopolymer transport protein ExbD
MRIRNVMAEGEEPYNLVPLTDMVFVLLIFFMSATTFVQVEKDMGLQLPKVGSAAGLAASATPQQLIINIKQDGTSVISGVSYRNLTALEKRVREAIEKNNSQIVIIRADERAVVKYFAEVARICKQAGAREAKLVYLDSNAKN